MKLRIDWSELDLYGHVNNIAFMKYIQAARVNYWEQIGLYPLYQQKKQFPMLVSTQCEFKKTLMFPGEVVIHSTLAYIKNSSFSIEHQLYNEKQELVAEAKDVMVMYDETKSPFQKRLR